MGLLDDLKETAGQAKDVAAGLTRQVVDDVKQTADHARTVALEHRDDIDRGIDKAADTVDDKTGRKHSKHIGTASNVAHRLVAKLERR